MNIFNRFLKPKWQHNKPMIRQQAIADLDDKNLDHRKILLEMANDADANTAQAAINKINELPLLQSLLDDPNKTTLHTNVSQRIIALLTQTPAALPLETQLSFIKHCQDISILVALAKANCSSSIQLAALAQIKTEQILADICQQASAPAVRLAAAEKVVSLELLQQLSKDMRNRDKNVYRLLKERLAAHAEENKTHLENTKLSQHIVSSIESLASKTYYPQYPQKFELLQKQWQALEAAYRDTTLEEKFQHASRTCHEVIQLEKAKLAQEQAYQQARTEQLSAISLLEDALKQFNEDIQTDTLDSSAFNALLKTQLIRWQNAVEIQAAESALQQRFDEASQLLEHGLLAYQRLQAQSNELLQLSETDRSDTFATATQKILADIHWPSALNVPPLLKKIHTLLSANKDKPQNAKTDKKQQAKELIEQVQQLSQALAKGEFKTANKLYKNLQQENQQQQLQHHASLQHEVKQLGMRLKDMNDWQDYASIQKKEELCQRMEALINHTQDLESKAEQIKALQQAWQHSGISNHKNAQPLWLRFKAASDQAYEPCKAYFQQQSEQRKKNLEARTELCDQLQRFIADNDWAHTNWKAVIEIIQTAKQQWKQHAQVDRDKAQAVQQRFNELLEQLETRVKAEKERSKTQKKALIQAMSELINHPDLDQAIEKTKALQAQWKQIISLSHKQDEALWQQFRQQCDAVFARRHEAQRLAQHEKDQQVSQAKALCQQLENATQDEKILREQHKLSAQLSKEFESLLLPRDQVEDLRKRFQKAKTAFNTAVQQATKQQRKQQLDTLRELSAWLASLESTDTQTMPERLNELWQTQTAQLSAEHLVHIKNRFNTLQQSLPPITLEQLQKDKALLCIQMEITAGIDSPTSEKAARMAYQVSRLSQGLSQLAEKNTSPLEQAITIEQQWLGLPVRQELAALEQRFNTAREAFWKNQTND